MASDNRFDTHWSILAGLRFCLAGIVACYHVDMLFGDGNGAAALIGSLGAKAAVSCFLLISGYSIAASFERRSSGFFRRRLVRIYPVYVFAILLATAAEVASGGSVQTRNLMLEGSGLWVALANLFMLQTFLVKTIVFDGPVWSLAVEVSYYLCTPLFAKLARPALLALIAISAASYATPRHDHSSALYFLFTHFNALTFAWAWLMGFYLFLDRRIVVLGGFAALGALLVLSNQYLNPEPAAPVMFLVCVAVLGVASRAKSGVSTNARVSRIASYLGDVSYPLYIMQYPAFLIAYRFLGVRDPDALLACALLTSIAAYHVLDVRVKHWFFRRPRPAHAVHVRPAE